MEPMPGTTFHGVHKDLTGTMVDDPDVVEDAYAYMRLQGDLYLAIHPELEVVDDTVVDVVFKMPDGSVVQRVEWQALVKEKAHAQG